ncbi:MAG: hypothetical protein N2595_07770 [bacterium]|nr:hypothetical protein [bacterium]
MGSAGLRTVKLPDAVTIFRYELMLLSVLGFAHDEPERVRGDSPWCNRGTRRASQDVHPVRDAREFCELLAGSSQRATITHPWSCDDVATGVPSHV